VDPGERMMAEREGAIGDLFASHPPMRIRLARLRAMGYAAAPGGEIAEPPGVPG
jgi:Zn-dependent protease with chaperone function